MRNSAIPSGNSIGTGALDPRLADYNRQIFSHQEEAYTLAYYLLGSVDAAAQAVQTALVQSFRHSGRGSAFNRLQLLKLVMQNCPAGQPAPLNISVADQALFNLPLAERRAIILVDVLGLSYAEAAQTLGCPVHRLSQLLAQGRVMAMEMK